MGEVVEYTLFILLSLLIGIIFRRISHRINFPYTPMILVVGMIWGLVVDYTGMFGDAGD